MWFFFASVMVKAKNFFRKMPLMHTIKVIDLSQDFRLGEISGRTEFVYGLAGIEQGSQSKSATILPTPDVLPLPFNWDYCHLRKQDY